MRNLFKKKEKYPLRNAFIEQLNEIQRLQRENGKLFILIMKLRDKLVHYVPPKEFIKIEYIIDNYLQGDHDDE